MATPQISTNAFPQIVNGGARSGYLLVDSNVLINFDRIGSLDTLLTANRKIVITLEVYREVVVRASSTPGRR